mgnify:CR=1 FL=1
MSQDVDILSLNGAGSFLPWCVPLINQVDVWLAASARTLTLAHEVFESGPNRSLNACLVFFGF